MNAVIAFALRQRVLMLLLLLFMLGVGVVNFFKLNIEAYPDPVPPLVDVVTQNPGQSAEEIERYITIPIEIQMAGIPNVTAVRTISLFGLSDVKVQFTYAFTYDEAQQWVINRLSQLSPLPNGATPQISPESPIGEIYRYRCRRPIRASASPISRPSRIGYSSAGSRRCPGSSMSPGGAARPRPTRSLSISTACWRRGSPCRRCCRRSTTATSMSAAKPLILGRRPRSSAASA